jgi:hypothetical protein
MEIKIRVNLVDLKRAFRRLLTRLSDESETKGDFIVFSAAGNSLHIVAGETSEVLSATWFMLVKLQFLIPSFVASGELYGSIDEV